MVTCIGGTVPAMASMSLAEVTAPNVRDACALRIKPEQGGMVAPVAESLAEAYVARDIAWPRLIYDGDQLVGFLMGGFAPTTDPPLFHCIVWRLLIAAEHQRKGYGRFAVQSMIEEARRRGHARLTATWSTAEHGPEFFWRKLGFRPIEDWDGRGEAPGELYF
jgi:diamine N-acetyltransferase